MKLHYNLFIFIFLYLSYQETARKEVDIYYDQLIDTIEKVKKFIREKSSILKFK